MKRITLRLTVQELTLLASLASDQLFRREFIDPKMPGHKANPGEVDFGKALVGRLRLKIDHASRDTTSVPIAVSAYALRITYKRQNRNPDAL